MTETSPDYDSFFRRYADAYERSLGERVETDLIRSFFAEDFLSLSVKGGIVAGRNDERFAGMLVEAYAFYKAIGTKTMRIDHVETASLYDGHDRVRVFYVADYAKKDGSTATISFDLVYLLQRRAGGPKIFAFIAGDEMDVYREHGLVGPDGQPL
ncbi:MAG: hypothetical protein QHC90_29050 [Shinella sp.]|nr:hypothetical protein [Shinella sp.]